MLLFSTAPTKLSAVEVNVPWLVIVPVIAALLSTTPLFIKVVAVTAALFVNVVAASTETEVCSIVLAFVTVTPKKLNSPLPVTVPFAKLLPV